MYPRLLMSLCGKGEVQAERNERVMGLTKEISRTNTRFHGKLIDSGPRDDTIAVMCTPVAGGPVGVSLGDGPHFSIPWAPSRDVKSHSLSTEAARKLGERSKMFQKPPLPSPARGDVIAKSSSTVDGSLRASYRGSSPAAVTPRSPSVRDGSNPVRDGSNPPC
ncbi:hypothetical protein C5167_015897 [Papaver somniferum]|nr:hypothetical protein C5167_015897 [Papaver somniferum]